jgi:hypothetical protein
LLLVWKRATLLDFFVLLVPVDYIDKLVGYCHKMAPARLVRTSRRYSQKTYNNSFQRFAIHGFTPRQKAAPGLRFSNPVTYPRK